MGVSMRYGTPFPNAGNRIISGKDAGGTNFFCKLPDGTQFCWGSVSIGRSNGQNQATVVFAAEFADTPIAFSNYKTGRPDLWHDAVTSYSTTGLKITLYVEASGSTAPDTIYYMAIGRRKD